MAAKPEGLEIDQDIAYQRREWRFERAAWATMALLVVAALLGAFGRGLLARVREPFGDATARVEYERLVRHHCSSSISLDVQPDCFEGSELRVWIGRAFLDRVELSRIVPEPARSEAGQDGQTFIFRVADINRPACIGLQFEPDGPDRIPLDIEVRTGRFHGCLWVFP